MHVFLYVSVWCMPIIPVSHFQSPRLSLSSIISICPPAAASTRSPKRKSRKICAVVSYAMPMNDNAFIKRIMHDIMYTYVSILCRFYRVKRQVSVHLREKRHPSTDNTFRLGVSLLLVAVELLTASSYSLYTIRTSHVTQSVIIASDSDSRRSLCSTEHICIAQFAASGIAPCMSSVMNIDNTKLLRRYYDKRQRRHLTETRD